LWDERDLTVEEVNPTATWEMMLPPIHSTLMFPPTIAEPTREIVVDTTFPPKYMLFVAAHNDVPEPETSTLHELVAPSAENVLPALDTTDA
jgi:hypothetical protein